MNEHGRLTDQEARIWSDPRFHELVKRRNRFMWVLFSLTCLLFFGYCLLVAFAPALLGISLWPGAASNIGIAVGMGVVVVTFGLTGVYVYQANREFDRRTRDILEQPPGDETVSD